MFLCCFYRSKMDGADGLFVSHVFEKGQQQKPVNGLK